MKGYPSSPSLYIPTLKRCSISRLGTKSFQQIHYLSGSCTLVVVEENPPPPHMIVKRFGCTAIHNKALYMCTIHSNTESSSAEANARYASESSFEEKKLSTSAFLKVITNRARSVKHCCPCSSEPPSRTVLLDGHLLFSSPGR